MGRGGFLHAVERRCVAVTVFRCTDIPNNQRTSFAVFTQFHVKI
jgi:hypothetical protein